MRYSRQVRFAPFGEDAQAELGRSSALIVGIGALGTHTAEALARAGVGHLTLVDRDIVEESNLQRQGLFTEDDAGSGAPKAFAAAEHLAAIRGDLQVDPHADDFSIELFEGLERAPDIILDGTDNFPTRYLINDLAVRANTPWVYGGAVGSTGTAAVILPGVTPCLRCRLPEPPEGAIDTCETAGILSPVIAMVAAFQTVEAMKILGGRTDDVCRSTLQFDLWHTWIRAGDRDVARPRGDCLSCGSRQFPVLAHHGSTQPSTVLCGRDAVQVHPRPGTTLDLSALGERLQRTDATDLVTRTGADGNAVLLRFALDGLKFSVFPGGRALIFGTDQPGRARALYDRYLT